MEKLTSDQMRIIEELHEDLKRTQGRGQDSSEQQIALLTQQLQQYEAQLT